MHVDGGKRWKSHLATGDGYQNAKQSMKRRDKLPGRRSLHAYDVCKVNKTLRRMKAAQVWLGMVWLCIYGKPKLALLGRLRSRAWNKFILNLG